LNALRTASSSQAARSLSLNRTSWLGTSVLIELCSTHGRVASALRARGGQPAGQVIPGTFNTTSPGAAGAGWLQPAANMTTPLRTIM
jgi:hypothetical protein